MISVTEPVVGDAFILTVVLLHNRFLHPGLKDHLPGSLGNPNSGFGPVDLQPSSIRSILERGKSELRPFFAQSL